MNAFWLALEHSGPATSIRQALWIYPALETIHILGVATLFGSIALLDLRLLGLSRPLPIGALARHALPAAYGGFAALVLTGPFLFISDAEALAGNRAFQMKLLLIALAGLNALAFNFGPLRRLRAEPGPVRPSFAVRTSAAASLVLWTAVIVCGRLIAYV